MVVHRRPPAKDVVADKKLGQNADGHGNQCDFGETRKLGVELKQRDGCRFRERCLYKVVKRTVPAIDRDADLNLKIGCE
jgi:hypothetical protein